MSEFKFKCVATTGESFETTIKASTLLVATIKACRERKNAFNNKNLIWVWIK